MNLAEEIRSTKVAPEELAICWLGQAGFLLKDHRGAVLTIDPYLTDCGARIRGFKRLTPMLLAPEEMRPDYHIITHLHFDHFDYDAVPVIAKTSPGTLFLGPSSCVGELKELGVPEERIRRLDRGEVYQDQQVSVRAVLADHGEMAPDAIGAVVEMGGHVLYFSGDTAFHEDLFREVAEFRPDFAAMSVNGCFGNLNAAEGAEAALLTGVKYAVPCHCWTFAEHGGNPGEFCERLIKSGRCAPRCFRQGEIQILGRENTFQRKKESA